MSGSGGRVGKKRSLLHTEADFWGGAPGGGPIARGGGYEGDYRGRGTMQKRERLGAERGGGSGWFLT